MLTMKPHDHIPGKLTDAMPTTTDETQQAPGEAEAAGADPSVASASPGAPVRSKRPLTGLILAQFFGAFNDNAWRLILFTLLMLQYAELRGTTEYEELNQGELTTLFLVFTLPMLVLSLPAGWLADRVSKRKLIILTKVAEVFLMGGAAAALYFAPTAYWIPVILVGLMGAQSALFSPAKYAIIPELIPHERLSEGNGTLEMWTMVAIIIGTAAGPLLLFFADGGTAKSLVFIAPLILVAFSLLGLGASLYIPVVQSAGSRRSMLDMVTGAWAAIRADRVLGMSIGGAIVAWVVLSLLGQVIVVYAKDMLATLTANGAAPWWVTAIGEPELLVGIPLAVFGVGFCIGAVLAGKLSRGIVEVGLIPLGAAILALFTLLLALIQPNFAGTNTLCLFVGVGAGMLAVPILALVQWRSPADRRGAVLAMTNVGTLTGTIGGSLASYFMSKGGLETWLIMLVSAVGIMLATAWALWLLPMAFVRLLLLILTRTFYRVTPIGTAHVPQSGGALLVPNHVTFVDGLFIIASLDRPVRFIVDQRYYNKWWLKPFMKAMGAIPISSTGGPRVILKALRDAGEYLDQGDLVCIFAEGQLSRTGHLMPFRRGLTRLVKGRDVPVIPVHLGNAWGSIFSYKGGRFVKKFPERIPYPVTVSFGEAMPSDTPLWRVRQSIRMLGTEAWDELRAYRRPLHRSFIRAVRRHRLRFAFGDPTRGDISSRRALIGLIALGRRLNEAWAGQKSVGIMLPPSNAGALVNIAAAAGGRVAVNLNYTTGQDALDSAARQAELKTVVTSWQFLAKSRVALPKDVKPLYVEDIAADIGAWERITAVLMAYFAPARLIERACGAKRRPTLDDEVAVIFSSGSTGEPKGVVLTHANVDANTGGAAQILHLRPSDRLLGILPLFHSFGYLAMWFAPNHGVGTFFLPNPLDAQAVGDAVERKHLTIMIATPTLLQLYMRRVNPHALGSLRLVLTGAEKLSDRVADEFEQTFGLRPIEGYGTTECAPVVAGSTQHIRYDGVYQAGWRRGSVGQPLPGVSVKIVDLDTGESLPPGSAGMMLVKGPNVMKGYLKRPDLTEQVLRDGWYVTGDIATIDPDGFIRITDRLSRFSKVGGEMVPHGKVEDALHEAAGVAEQTFAVTSVPDERKGERLAVVHTYDEKRIAELIDRVAETGLSKLFIPRRDQFVKVDRLPLLGTGKLDLRRLKAIATEALDGEASA